MRSILRVASLAVASLAILSRNTAQAQDTHVIDVISGLSSNAGSFDPLAVLAEGPYPRGFTEAFRGLPPMIGAVAPNALDKRGYYCDPGYGLCPGNYCCSTSALCGKHGGCCSTSYPWYCANVSCCRFNSCTSSGYCGCPASYPVMCSDGDSCCPSGYVCIGGGKCQGYVPAPPPPPPPSPPSPPPPPPPPPPPVDTTTTTTTTSVPNPTLSIPKFPTDLPTGPSPTNGTNSTTTAPTPTFRPSNGAQSQSTSAALAVVVALTVALLV